MQAPLPSWFDLDWGRVFAAPTPVRLKERRFAWYGLAVPSLLGVCLHADVGVAGTDERLQVKNPTGLAEAEGAFLAAPALLLGPERRGLARCGRTGRSCPYLLIFWRGYVAVVRETDGLADGVVQAWV